MIETLRTEIKKAMVNRTDDPDRLKLLRMIMSGIQDVALRDKRKDINEDDLIKAVTSGISERKKAIQKFEEAIQDIIDKKGSVDDDTKQGSDERITKLKSEIVIYEEFLPMQLTDEEVEVMVDKAIADTGASIKKDMGKVMGRIKKEIPSGAYEMKKLSQMILSKLD